MNLRLQGRTPWQILILLKSEDNKKNYHLRNKTKKARPSNTDEFFHLCQVEEQGKRMSAVHIRVPDFRWGLGAEGVGRAGRPALGYW